LVALVASRVPRFRVAHGLVAFRIALLALIVLGIGVAVRAFRTA
jgi:hypothetical protein